MRQRFPTSTSTARGAGGPLPPAPFVALLFLVLLLPGASVSATEGRGPFPFPSRDLPLDWSRETILGVLGPGWHVVRTPHVRVHVEPGLDLDHADLVGLEAELTRLFEVLGADDSWRAELRARPFDYFFTVRRALYNRFSGVESDGIAFPEQRIALAQRLPLGHELAHLVVHHLVGPAPSGSEPLLQEGLASWLAGDSSEGRRVVLAHADRLLDATGLDPGVLWTPARFHASPLAAWEKYAVAARLVDFLVATRGLDRVLWLYRLLCAEGAELESRPYRAVLLQVEQTAGAPWPVVRERFHAWRARHPVGGLQEVQDPDPRLRTEPVSEARAGLARARTWREPAGSLLVELLSRDESMDLEFIWGERVGREPILAAPTGERRRFSLRVDFEGAELRDYLRGRAVGRCWWAAGETSSRRVLRIDADLATELGELDAPVLFESPRFEVPPESPLLPPKARGRD